MDVWANGAMLQDTDIQVSGHPWDPVQDTPEMLPCTIEWTFGLAPTVSLPIQTHPHSGHLEK